MVTGVQTCALPISIACLRDLIARHPPEIFGNVKGLQSALYQKLGAEKAQIMAYILGRMNYSVRMPLSSATAKTIADAAAKKLTRHAAFNTERALLDLKKYEVEVKVLGAFAGNKDFKQDLKKTLMDFKQDAATAGNKLFSGME